MIKTVTAYAAVEGDAIVAYTYFAGATAVFVSAEQARVHCPQDARIVPITITYDA